MNSKSLECGIFNLLDSANLQRSILKRIFYRAANTGKGVNPLPIPAYLLGFVQNRPYVKILILK